MFLKISLKIFFQLQHRCFPVNIVKFLRKPFLRSTSRLLLLKKPFENFRVSWHITRQEHDFNKQKSQACNFIKKETLAQVFFCEFCEIFKNIFLQNTSWGLLLNKAVPLQIKASKLAVSLRILGIFKEDFFQNTVWQWLSP